MPLDTSKVKVITDSMLSSLSAVPCYSYFLELFEQDIFNQNFVFKTFNPIKHKVENKVEIKWKISTDG